MMVDTAVIDRWLSWMQDDHIPHIMDSGCFLRYQFVRVLDTEETHGLTFALQLYAPDRAAYDTYLREFAGPLQRETARLWGEKSLSFGTLMEVVK